MPASPAPQSGWELARFLLMFVVYLVAGVVLLDLEWVRHWLVDPWTRLNAAGAAALSNALGVVTTAAGTQLFVGNASLNILDGCNGAQAVLIFLASVASFPATWTWRGFGLLAGTVLLFGANLLRLVNLVVVARYYPAQIEVFHVYVWQVLIVLIAFGLFLLWASRSAPPPARDGG